MATAARRDIIQTDKFVVTSNGQTNFTLTETPVDVSDVKMVVNGSTQRHGSSDDFVVSGTLVTWLNNDFTLAIGDTVEFSYEF